MHLISDALIFRACSLAQSAAMAVVLSASAASATEFIFTIDDLTDMIRVTQFKDGKFNGDRGFPGEVAQDSFTLNGTYNTAAFPFNVNIVGSRFDPEEAGRLSDTFRIEVSGQPSPGNVTFTYTFTSDIDPFLPETSRLPTTVPDIEEMALGPLEFQPISSAIMALLPTSPGGDTALFFFRSDVPIPGPVVGAGLPGLLLLAIGGLLGWWRRRRKIV